MLLCAWRVADIVRRWRCWHAWRWLTPVASGWVRSQASPSYWSSTCMRSLGLGQRRLSGRPVSAYSRSPPSLLADCHIATTSDSSSSNCTVSVQCVMSRSHCITCLSVTYSMIICIGLFIFLFQQALLWVHSTKHRHQSAQWTIWATSIVLFRERLFDFRSCWIVFIHVVRGLPGGLLQFSKGNLLRSSWHVLLLAFAQCGQTGRNAVLGQWPKGVVAHLSVSCSLIRLNPGQDLWMHLSV